MKTEHPFGEGLWKGQVHQVEVGFLLSGKYWDPAKCSPPPQVILYNLEPMTSTGLFPWASALGGEPYDQKAWEGGWSGITYRGQTNLSQEEI